MKDTITNEEDIKSYLISGATVKILRKRLKIGFNAFCFKAGISTRTLAYIERSESIIIKATTMRSLMIAFNLTRNGRRSRPILQSKFTKGGYTKSHPELLASHISSRKMTVYVDASIRRGVATYARSNNLSENKALLSIARNYLGIADDKMRFARNINSFSIIASESL